MMNILSCSRLLTTFLPCSATKPTRHLLAWFLLSQMALEPASSARCLYRQFLSKQADAPLNDYCHALASRHVTDAFIR